MDYIPYLRHSLLGQLRQVQAGAAEVAEVVATLDAYGLTRDDFMENMKDLQMVIENDKTLIGKRFRAIHVHVHVELWQCVLCSYLVGVACCTKLNPCSTFNIMQCRSLCCVRH
jgi:hypothetical protein